MALELTLIAVYRCSYQLLNNETIALPWIYSVGDRLGLYPIAYASRVAYYQAHPLAARSAGYSNSTDLALLRHVCAQYIMAFPWRLADGTFARPIDWLSDGYISWPPRAVWVDDSYMGTAVLAATGAALGEPDFLAEAALQLLGFDRHLRDPTDNLCVWCCARQHAAPPTLPHHRHPRVLLTAAHCWACDG